MPGKYQRWKNIMKAYPLEEKRLMKWQPPYIVQPKYDGFRSRAVPIHIVDSHSAGSGPGYMMLSSEENPFFSVPHLAPIFSALGLGAEFDGELYNHEMYKEGGFDLLSSILSRTVNLHPRYKEIQFHLFDIINDQPQMRRQLTIENLRGLSPWIVVAPFWLCESFDDVMRTYDKLIEMGYEGIIVRNVNAPYQRKRSTLVMKFKPKKEDIYEIVGWEEERTVDKVPKGRLGAIVCKSGDGETFSVGTGYDDSAREELWARREELPGKLLRVEYQHLTPGRKVPRFCRSLEVIEND